MSKLRQDVALVEGDLETPVAGDLASFVVFTQLTKGGPYIYAGWLDAVDDGMVTSKRPDEKLRLDPDTGNWGFTEPDWEEFYRVIRGNGPCNRKRLALRRFSYTQGRWVRNAILHGSAVLPPAA